MSNYPRDTYRYKIKEGNTILYIGITNDPDRREIEHKNDGKRGKLTTEGPIVTRQTAQKWEREALETYRRNHCGENPLYNQTNHG